MSNHTHVVVHVDKEIALSWTINEVLLRYHRLHKGTLLTQKYMSGNELSSGEYVSFIETVEVYRARLYNISWFMRDLNEHIARQANKEDNCSGRFWEGRFKSQALLDESALLSCMAYVDLNPIRAKISKAPETAEFTSIKKRIEAVKNKGKQASILMPFIGGQRQSRRKGIAFNLNDYFELVDMTGRCIRNDKAAYIENTQNPILERLGLHSNQWLSLSINFEKHFCYAAGSELVMNKFKSHTNHKRLRGMGQARTILGHS
ncbi:transposase [Aliiglaciecola litoralis]|uniref:Transposase n=2 Tax=Aliiglaciecola litoralis TaxID=582857 RepID=A0ABN1LF27_9ALTE